MAGTPVLVGDTQQKLVKALKQVRDRDPVAFALLAKLAERLSKPR